MNKDKSIKDLKKYNDKLKNQIMLLETRNYSLQYRLEEKDKEIERLNNIIDELEKLIDSYELGKYDYEIPVVVLKDKLKELKEGKE